MSCTCHIKQRSRPQNVPKVPCHTCHTKWTYHIHIAYYSLKNKQRRAGKSLRLRKSRKHTLIHVVPACAVEMHMDMSQGNFSARIYNEKAGAQMEHPDLTRPFTPTERTHQYGQTVWGIKLWIFEKYFWGPNFQKKPRRLSTAAWKASKMRDVNLGWQ